MSVSAATPTGNTYDKYGSRNPVVRRVMRGFEGALDELLADAGPTAILDVGCGEGVLSARWAARPAIARVVGVDLEDPELGAEWAARESDKLTFRAYAGAELPFAADEFDLVTAIEALEHVPDPEATLAEMARVARSHVLASVPREPLWRGLNLARGAYLRELGDTPGHLHHFSQRGFVRLLARHGEVTAVRSPFPWTMVLVRV
jgi:2-polyprenyl-3-methyl-5-hydroxy-6-metoxy-1,4-benzoquinol methylase